MFLQSLLERGMRGMKLVVSDDHAGLKAARQAVMPGVPWQADVLRDVLAEVALADLSVI
jgi:transposase-like protein